MESLLQMLITIAVILAMARLASAVFAKFGLPGLIGEILVGILIANIAGGAFMTDWLGIVMPDPAVEGDKGSAMYHVLYALSELGVIFLLFSVGLETKVSDLLGSGKTAFLVALLGVIFPFIAGFALIIGIGGYSTNAALFMGAAMVATSVGITARIIKDMKLMNAKESRIIIAAAVIDDVLGMIVLAIVQGIATSESIQVLDLIIIILKASLFVVGIILFAKYIVPKIYDYFDAKNRATIASGKTPYAFNKFIISIILCISMAALAEGVGLAAIIGAFLAGMIFAEYAWEWDLVSKAEVLTSFLISFFFVDVGMKVHLSSLQNGEILMLAGILIVLALITKYVGCGLGAKIGDKSIDKSSFNIIGVGMMPRGEVGIIIASIGLTGGILSNDLYSIIVLMSVATTIIAPPILASLFKKKYKDEMQITQEDRF